MLERWLRACVVLNFPGSNSLWLYSFIFTLPHVVDYYFSSPPYSFYTHGCEQSKVRKGFETFSFPPRQRTFIHAPFRKVIYSVSSALTLSNLNSRLGV